MNQRTVKLLRRYAATEKLKLRSVKRFWNREPWPRRAALRQHMSRAVAEFEGQP